MKCTIAANNVKVLAKSIHALARIGEDMYVETDNDKVLLHTVNSSRSAYVCFTLEEEFFSKYVKNADIKCKVCLKSCLAPFRSIPELEKSVDTCVLDTSSVPDHLLLEFNCKRGMSKMYHLPFIDNDTIQAQFSNKSYQSKFTAQSRLLTDGMQNFSNSVEEVTLAICFDRLTFKNYVEDEPDPNKIVHTELTLESAEFEEFETQQETEITFCLKELRALLNFAEGSNVPIIIYCHGAGKPIIFLVESISGVKSEFVLATLANTDMSQASSISSGKMSVVKLSAEPRHGSKGKPVTQKDKVASNCSPPEMPVRDAETASSINAVTNIDSVCYNSGAPETSENNHGFDINNTVDTDDVMEVEECAVIPPSTPPEKRAHLRFLGHYEGSEYSTMNPDEDVLVPDSDEEV